MEVSQHNISNLKKVHGKVIQYPLNCLYYAEKYFLQLLRTTYIKGLTIRITDIKGLNIFGNMFLYTT